MSKHRLNIIKIIKKTLKKMLMKNIKIKKEQFGHKRFKNVPEDEKQSLLSIEKNIIK